ncbi:MAG: glutamine--fructose-6-phosphate transaminase (isomerizing) [Clostridia bacterium]|nr:glutamine--fructose-6-phosphate transaminase (isomerizing) [Clostridia bacterium]
MCGIVGYVGEKQAAPILLEGLSKLEYRGYDSAGIAVFDAGRIHVVKTKGRLAALSDMIDGGASITSQMGIGHTRWATHGEPSDVNSHPHISNSGKFAVVHNGIIENYFKLKEFLENRGYNFVSQTDTEVVAHLVDFYYDGDMLSTVTKVISRLEGSYALGIISCEHPDSFIAVRKDSPLIVGLGENENFIASDIPAILSRTRDVYLLEDNEIVILKKDNVSIYDIHGEPITKEIFHVDWDVSAAEKGGYEHFMFKEMMEQPKVLKDTIHPRIQDGNVVLDDISLTAEDIASFNKISIIGCGSAYHVGCVGKYVIEKLARIPVEVELASEFRYRFPIVDDKTLVIVISQSGETADTLAALRDAKKSGARIMSIVNVVGSSIARESDDVIYTWAGPEIAVATTKAYSTQLSVIYLIALYLADKKELLSAEDKKNYIDAMLALPDCVETVIGQKETIQYLASKFYNVKDVFYIGRGVDYAASMEGSLKLKEISYVHSEAYAAGELKHGTISLIEEGTLVVALCSVDMLFEKMLSNIKEVKARGAVVWALTFEGNTAIEAEADHVLYVPRTVMEFAPSCIVPALQLFGYYVSALRGLDIDKPRNLAKSVTVE